MRPAENALARARQIAHDNLRQQAFNRVTHTVDRLAPRTESASSMAAHAARNQMGQQLAGANLGSALNGGPGQVTAPMLRGAGQPAAAASLFESRHPAAMAGRAPIPSWVLTQMSKEMQGNADQNPGFIHTQPSYVEPGGGSALPGQRVELGPGMVSPFRLPHPGIPQLPEHPLGSGEGFMPRFIHLGGGLFLHPETGEVHGMGAPVSSTPNALPVHPGMVAL